jgi:hypothetical protein
MRLLLDTHIWIWSPAEDVLRYWISGAFLRKQQAQHRDSQPSRNSKSAVDQVPGDARAGQRIEMLSFSNR